VVDDPETKRELAVFAASVELAEVEAKVWSAERLRAYWRGALGLDADASVDGYLNAAWCGVFVLWCLHEGGIAPDLHWHIGAGFVGPAKLELTKTPKPGDVAYNAHLQHHAIVVAVEGEDVHTLDGNQGWTTPIKARTRKLIDWTAFYSIERLLTEGP